MGSMLHNLNFKKSDLQVVLHCPGLYFTKPIQR